MYRRDFLALMGGAALAPGLRAPGAPASGSSPTLRAGDQVARNPLQRLSEVGASELSLPARRSSAAFGSGTSEVWTLGGSFPSPTIRVQRGERARIELRNELAEPTIVHWHGLDVPEAADGHPRLAVGPGESYRYDFEIADPAGTYWYHPHTHRRTAPQTYMGMAGLLVVQDEDEARFDLPDAEREIGLILQDKRLDGDGALTYEPRMGPDRMFGYLGDAAFGNGVPDPRLEVRRGSYRLRVLNASNSRIFRLAFDDGRPLTLIGNDGGLLDGAESLDWVMLGTGERADLLLDFSDRRPGERSMLRSEAFEIPGAMGMAGGVGGRMGRGRGMMGAMMSALPQGAAMDLLEVVVAEGAADPSWSPRPLKTLAEPQLPEGTSRHVFRFDSMMMSHTINGRSFELDRIDHRIRLGETQIWSFVNQGPLPHPVHVHGGRFRVLDRRGGRGRVLPWERGAKDTVLTFPGETVDIAVRFANHPGVFLMHCHNLDHEDQGMMMNFEVVE